jgi:hypothetical protein
MSHSVKIYNTCIGCLRVVYGLIYFRKLIFIIKNEVHV